MKPLLMAAVSCAGAWVVMKKRHAPLLGAAMVAALALAVPVPFVSPDGQAVVPLPAVFLSGAGKLLAL